MTNVMQTAMVGAVLWGAASVAQAQWSVSGGLEYFRWRESSSPGVTETGPRFTAGLNWVQPKDSGWLAAYHGTLYTGRDNYTGASFVTGAPLSGHTVYNGITNEVQAIYRTLGTPGFTVDYVGGLGWDYWRRNLSAAQREDYSIVFVRAGVDLNARAQQGWIGGGGIKYTPYTHENAHLNEIGFDQNPSLQPGKSTTVYAQLGYRFNRNWDLVGYYDGYRFGQSNFVTATANATFPRATFSVFQPKSSMDVFGLKVKYTF